ncbi:hypothetical protein [Streptomyces sp. DSM 40907]|uniref:hypothetical protein n=1 Tax=Streptomyces kutzneri TaxID=3051179 RepID=UPI0028D548F0|nr:hypothetical protein [Streptomyces sp. DSM 40907]
MEIIKCYDATTADGNPNGYACEGAYTPRSSDVPQGEISLRRADKKHRAGSLVEVRTAGGVAYEMSGSALSMWMSITWILFAPFLILSIWLLTCARHASWAQGNGWIPLLMFTVPLSPLVFGVAGLAVDGVRAVFG